MDNTQGMVPLMVHSLTLRSITHVLLISDCWLLTTLRTRALELELFMFVHMSVGVPGFCSSTGLGGEGCASQQLWDSGLPTRNQSWKAAAIYGKLFLGNEKGSRWWVQICEATYGLEVEHCHFC